MAHASRHRVDLDSVDFAMLEALVERTGLNRSEIVKRLVKTAFGAGPFLTAANSQEIASLSQQLRLAGGNLFGLLDALRQGFAVSDSKAEAVWQELHDRVTALEDLLASMTETHGVRLRSSLRKPEPVV
jgi:hypothetical protein